MNVDEMRSHLASIRSDGETVYGFTLSPPTFDRFKESVRSWFVSRGNSPNGVAIADAIVIDGVVVVGVRWQMHSAISWPSEEVMRSWMRSSGSEWN